MFNLWHHTKHYWVLYAGPINVKTDEVKKIPDSIMFLEKCYGCGRIRTITITHGTAPVVREGEEA